MSIHYILTDIEGTTTDIDFVHKVLFPYSKTELHDFICANDGNREVMRLFDIVGEKIAEEQDRLPISARERMDYLIFCIDNDIKYPPLKQLQGLIWRAGYEQKHFAGHIYKDVRFNLALWAARGIKLGVYSSGSVAAQKLLFGYSDEGDLNHFFSDNFDTAVGHKQETGAYANIIAALRLAPQSVLFLSDVAKELDAAAAAGMQTIQLVRDAKTKPSENHRFAFDFNDVTRLCGF